MTFGNNNVDNNDNITKSSNKGQDTSNNQPVAMATAQQCRKQGWLGNTSSIVMEHMVKAAATAYINGKQQG